MKTESEDVERRDLLRIDHHESMQKVPDRQTKQDVAALHDAG